MVPRSINDERGSLTRIFCDQELTCLIGGRKIKQINITKTIQTGTVRGLHFQRSPFEEMKIVTCRQGEVFDVAVDARPNSPTYLQHHIEILSDINSKMVLIPEGVAHGFQALRNDCELIYLHTELYERSSEAGLNALDPVLAINWPKKVEFRSLRDQNHPFITMNPKEN
jgi:dTDP-4-dehydrorhamnose 3,5-epimerase